MTINDIVNKDGSLNYGTIGGFKDRLDGHDSSLADIATNARVVFGLNGNGVNDNSSSFANALNSNYSTIYLPDGTFKITQAMVINSGIPKKIVGSKNTVISVQLPSSQNWLNMSVNIAFENITFDFNNGYVQTALLYNENLGKISLKNLKFQNVKDMDSTTSSIMVSIPTYGNTVDIDTIEFNSLLKKGNGSIGDAAGNITGIYYTDKTTVAPTNGIIRNIRIIEMHNINSSGSIIFEDTSGVYPFSAYTGSDGNLLIDNVYGYNFGKRLIKLDNQNTTINNVYAFSNTNDTLAAIGINNTGGTKIKNVITNVQIYGNMNIGISTNQNNTVISDVIIDIQIPNMAGNNANAFGINVMASQVSINNAIITSERNIVITGSSLTNYIQDLKISNSVLTVPTWGVINVHITSSTPYGFKNLLLQNVTAINNANGNGFTGSFIDTTALSGNSWGQRGKGLSLINCTFYGAIVNNYGLNLKYVDDINITNYTYNNDGVTQAYSAMYMDTCKNINITNFSCNAYVSNGIKLMSCDNVRVLSVSSPSTTYVISANTSTSVRLRDLDKTKVVLNDATTLQGTMLQADSSYGTTSNRPLGAYQGMYHYDTSLSKPIFCKTTGTAEVDTLTISTGATTSGNITITLNGISTTVAVTAGDSAGTIGDKVRGAAFKQWLVGGTTGSATVTFTKTTGGTNTTPTFADTGTTGTSAGFAVTTAGANPAWVDATGTAV